MMNNKLIIDGTEHFPKMLEWTSVISEEGEAEGIIGFDCDILQNGDLKTTPKNYHHYQLISFMIRNFGQGDGLNKDPKIHLWVKRSVMDEKKYDFDTVQEAKEMAQVIWNDFAFEYIKRFFY